MNDSPADGKPLAKLIRKRPFQPIHAGKGGILTEYLMNGVNALEGKYGDQKKFFRFLGRAVRDKAVVEAVAALRDSIIRYSLTKEKKNEGTIVALTGVQGGEGTSFLSVMLAVSLGAFTHRRVAFLDSRFNMRRFEALTDVLGLSPDSFSTKGTSTKITGYYKLAQPNVYFLKSEGSEQAMEFFSDKQLHRFLTDVRTSFDFTIVDMPSLLREPNGVFLAPNVDRLYAVVSAGKTKSREFERLLDVCRESKVEVAGVIMNRQKGPLWSHLFWRDYFFSPRTYVPPPPPPMPEFQGGEFGERPYPYAYPPHIQMIPARPKEADIPEKPKGQIEGPRGN